MANRILGPLAGGVAAAVLRDHVMGGASTPEPPSPIRRPRRASEAWMDGPAMWFERETTRPGTRPLQRRASEGCRRATA